MPHDVSSDSMSIPRFERWKNQNYISIGYTRADETSKREQRVIDLLHRVRTKFYEAQDTKPPRETIFDWIRRCKELIYDIKDGKPVIHAIGYTYNVGRGELEIGPLFDILVAENSAEHVGNEIRNTLAYALFAEVPVFPNTEELAPELARYYRDLMVEGFTAPDECGKRIRLMPTGSPGRKVETVEFLREICIAQPRQPAELALLREAVERELDKLSTADRVLCALSVAIDDLSSHLNTIGRNESELQRCLTAHPVLFGLEYRRVIPKHRLGSEYEMDFALERVSGLVDLAEIEASVHRLFNKNGDPRKELIHAEQQALNWLEWLERHHPYARDKFPGLMRPRAYVIIGRQASLTETERRKLALRNALFGESLQVLTYDDLLARAENIRNLLVGQTTTEGP